MGEHPQRSMNADDGANPSLPLLNPAEAALLTEARTEQWKLELYEFAYDAAVRVMSRRRTIIQYSGVAIALIFLYLRFLAKGNSSTYGPVSDVGTALSLAVILASIWAAFARWPDQIEKKRDLSRQIRDLLGKHKKLADARPLDEKRLRAWLSECHDFEEKRKSETATVDRYYLILGFQHIGNLHPRDGVMCSICSRKWTPESNKQAWRAHIPFIHCKGCGVKP